MGWRSNTIAHPFIGSAFLPRTPYEGYKMGKAARVPALIGWNSEEAGLLIRKDKVIAAGFESDLIRAFGPLPPSIFVAYPDATDVEAIQARLNFERDLRFGWDMWAWGRLQNAAPAYVHDFGYQPPFPAKSPYAGWSAIHCAELWYMFGNLNQADWAWQARDRHLEQEMTGYWTNF